MLRVAYFFKDTSYLYKLSDELGVEFTLLKKHKL